MAWIEIRCSNKNCDAVVWKDGTRRVRHDGKTVNPKLMGMFLAGSIAADGVLKVKCPSCGNMAVVTERNQYGDGYNTFLESEFTPKPIHVDAKK